MPEDDMGGMKRGLTSSVAKDRIGEALLELSPDAIMVLDSNGAIVDCSEGALELFGYKSKGDLIGRDWFNLISDVCRGRAKMDFNMLQTRVLKNVEYKLVSRSRGEFDGLVSAKALSLPSGEIIGFLAMIKPVTEGRVKGKPIFYEALKRFAEGLDDVVFLYDQKDGYLYVNRASVKITGYTPEEFYADRDLGFKMTHPDDLLMAKDHMANLIEGKRPSEFRLRILTKNGKVVWVEELLSPVLDDSGEVIAIFGIVKDITCQKRVEEELKTRSKELEDLVRERTEQLREAEHMAAIGRLAAMVGHDLRNPLQALLNEVYLIREKCRTVAQKIEDGDVKRSIDEYFNRINEQVRYMNKIISDLQDYTQPLKPDKVKTNLSHLIHSTLLTTNIPSTVSVVVNVPPDLYVDVDPLMMERVFVNLFLNAVQAMPNGGQLSISSSLEGDELLVKVSDTGIGIPKESTSEIFRPLFTTKSKGQGLGLPICRRIVEAHKGSISFESKVNEGTTFTIKLPHKPG